MARKKKALAKSTKKSSRSTGKPVAQPARPASKKKTSRKKSTRKIRLRKSSRVSPGTRLKRESQFSAHRKKGPSVDIDGTFAPLDSSHSHTEDYTTDPHIENSRADDTLEHDPYDHLEEPEGAVMSIGDHLEEFRRRLFVIVGITATLAIAIGIISPQVHSFLVGPFTEITHEKLHLRTGYGGIISLFKISLILASILAFPINLSVIWGFITPAISRKIRWIGYLVVYASSLLFWSGLAVCWFYLYRLALHFMFQEFLLEGTIAQHPLEEYYSFLFMIHIGSGLVFQLPLVIVILGAIGIIGMDWHAQYWKFIIVGIFVIAAIITPPDPITQLVMGGMLVMLYSISVLIVWLMEKARRKKYSVDS